LPREETTDLLQKLSLDSQPKAADATDPAGGAKKVVFTGSHLLLERSWFAPQLICDSDSPVCLFVCLFVLFD
jgi:hypothetical protein